MKGARDWCTGSCRLLIRYFVITFVSCLASVTAADESGSAYTEELTLRPLPNNLLQASFEFISRSEKSIETTAKVQDPWSQYSHYTLFPRSLGQIIENTHIKELHLRFAQGWWDSDNWGVIPNDGKYAGGIGVEMWAWIEGQDQQEAEARWKHLANTLSGLFCASLNFLDSAHTTFPANSFSPFSQGAPWSANGSNSENVFLLRGALPAEPVCTENLTPFIKQLPCKGKAGISSLLDGHKIFDTQWQAMSIDVFPIYTVDDDGSVVCQKEMVQKIDAVIDVPSVLSRRKFGVAKPIPFEELKCDESKPYNSEYHCFPKGREAELSWKISDIFGRDIQGSCSLATNDHNIVIDATDSWEALLLSKDTEDRFVSRRVIEEVPKTDQDSEESATETIEVEKLEIETVIVEKTLNEGTSFVLPAGTNVDLKLSSRNSTDITPINQPQVLVERSFTGYGQQRGGLRSVFTNPSTTEPVEFVYFETLPWFMRVYLHTLSIETRELNGIFENNKVPLPSSDIVKEVYFRPAIDREQPLQIEIRMKLPAATVAALSYDFDKTLLFIEEYPPDANHGFNIAPGVLTVLGSKFYTSRTTSLLLSLPTPDFSMPYNVVILACTVMALNFGTVFNLLIKRVVTEEEAERTAADRPLSKIVAKVKLTLKNMVEKKEVKRQPFPYEEKRKITSSVTE